MAAQEAQGLSDAKVVVGGSGRIPCGGNACSCTRVKSTQGYPDPPKARIRNSCSHDVIVTIKWGNMLGHGFTTHEVWAGETEDVDGPPQYWGIIDYKANKA